MAKKKKGEAEDDQAEADEKPSKKKGAKDEGEEGAEGEGAEGDAAPKKSKKKIIILGVLALVLIIGGVAGAYFMGYIGHHDDKSSEAAAEKSSEKAVFYTMPEFLANLNTGGKQVSYLKTTIILELAHQGDVQNVEANLPRLFDSLNTYLRELRASDLAGSAGIQRLREELLQRANQVLAPVKLNDILFKEIIVQ